MMKNKKCRFRLFFVLILLLGSLCSCSSDNANIKIRASENYYMIHYLKFNNILSGPGTFTDGDYLTTEIVSDFDRYAELLSDIKENVETDASEMGYNIRIDDWWVSSAGDVPNDFPEALSLFNRIDEDVFEDYDLLMIDFLCVDTIDLEAELDNLSVENNLVSIDLKYSIIATSTSDNCGVLYFVRIPKGCTAAAVDLVLNEEDSILQAGPGF